MAKERSDKGSTRVINVRDPETFTISLKGHGIDAQVGQALERDLERIQKQNPKATYKHVLLEWLSDYLGLKS